MYNSQSKIRYTGIILWGIFLITLIKIYLCFSQEPKSLKFLPLISNKTEEEQIRKQEVEKVLEIIKTAYTEKNYEKVIELSKKIPPDFSLTPEENILMAESYLNTGYPENAINFSDKVISVKIGTYQACLANEIKIKAFIVKGDYQNAQKQLKDILDSYCEENFKNEAKALFYFITKSQEYGIDKNLLKKTAGELYLIRGTYFLNKDNFKRAREDFFTYINVYGMYQEAPELIFKLAEAYFKKADIEEAKTLYELIITEWDGSKFAFLSKFRLYQLAYEKILVKELVPQKTKQDLLSFITLIKNRYPEEKIIEEANFWEIKMYFEDKNYLSSKKYALEFLSSFKDSPFYESVKNYYCESVTNILENAYQRENWGEILNVEKEDRENLKIYKCKSSLYTLGKIYLNTNFLQRSVYYLIRAYEIQGDSKLNPYILLNLSLVAFETGEREIFEDLFSFFLTKYSKEISNEPFYFYLRCCYEINKNFNSAKSFLKIALNSSLSDDHKNYLLKIFRDKAIELKNYEEALSYTESPLFKARAEDYFLLLLYSFDTKPNFFEKVLEIAKKKYPENSKIKWIEAYYLEKKGDIKFSSKIWEELKKGSYLENELAQSYEKMKELIDRSHQILY